MLPTPSPTHVFAISSIALFNHEGHEAHEELGTENRETSIANANPHDVRSAICALQIDMAQSELVNQPALALPAVRSPASPTRKALRRFRRHRLAMFGVVVILVLVVAALLGSEQAALTQNLRNAN